MADFDRLIESQNHLLEQLILGTKIEWWYSLFSTAAGGVIAALMGAAVAYILTDKLHRKDDHRKWLQAQKISLVKLVEEFESRSIEYWSRNRCEEKDTTDEIKMKVLHSQIRRNFKIFTNKDVSNKISDRIHDSIAQLYDHALGGTFESQDKKVSTKNVRKTQNFCGSIVTSIANL
ncbi:hypothetical protein [Teredinibacter haidensis]|uniref:hypothetical protein n=1 Tax=Teredinibacter haidensis TaxID=2731755 RepID=UPI0009489C58|nr:hypothetical protein [Teredinibacter haidensis]